MNLESQSRINSLLFSGKLVLQVPRAPIYELDHEVPKFFKYKLEIQRALELALDTISLIFVIDVHRLVSVSLGDIEQGK